MISFQNVFKSTFYAELLDSSESTLECMYCYPGSIEQGVVQGIGVDIYPNKKNIAPWFASFSDGGGSPNAIDFCGTHPDNKSLVVISKGAGYIVNSENPKEWKELSISPIIGAVIDKENRVIILHDFSKIMAIGKSGVLWITPSVSWDGIKDCEVKKGFVNAQVWDAPKNKFSTVNVELVTGSFNGGSSPELLHKRPKL